MQFERRGRARSADKPGRSASAEILMFTGVRYERDPAVTTPTKPTVSPRSKRKRG